MIKFPYPKTVGGLIEIVLDELVHEPDGKMVPGRQLFREFVPYGFDDHGCLAQALGRLLATNATVPSRLLFGINSRSTPRSGDVWIAEVSRLVIRTPRCSSRLHAEAPRFAEIAARLPKPGYVSISGSEFVYAIWEMVTQRDPRDVFPDLLRLEQGLGLEVSKEPAYMLPVPGSLDWSTCEPRSVTFAGGTHPRMFRNNLCDLMDQLDFLALPAGEPGANPYRPEPPRVEDVPDTPQVCLVRFRRPVSMRIGGGPSITVEVMEGPLTGLVWRQGLGLSSAVFRERFLAAGLTPPDKPKWENDVPSFIGHGAKVSVRRTKPRKVRIVEWHPFDDQLGPDDADR